MINTNCSAPRESWDKPPPCEEKSFLSSGATCDDHFLSKILGDEAKNKRT